MNLKSKKFIAKYESMGSCVLFMPPSQWVMFGDNSFDDMVVRWTASDNSSKAFLLQDGDIVDVPEQNCIDLFQTVRSLANTAAFGMVSMSAENIALIKQSIDKLNATHVRIIADSGRVRVHVFDYRLFATTSRINRKVSHKIEVIPLKRSVCADFTVTLKSKSFKRLDSTDFQIRVGKNGILVFSGIKETADVLFRDQELVEPVSTFFSPRLNQEIAFVPVPKS